MRKLNRERPNSVLRLRRQSLGDLDTIDMEEAASILGKSTRTLQRWRAIGYGPSFKLDGPSSAIAGLRLKLGRPSMTDAKRVPAW